VESFVSGESTRGIRGGAAGLSARYRSAESGGGRFVRTSQDVLAYVAYRLPATFAAAHASLSEVRRLKPEWNPLTLLDLGGGPGTVGWAATALWPSIRQVTVVETNPHMIRAGRELCAASTCRALRETRWLQADITELDADQHGDLVTAAYALGEISESSFDPALSEWWNRAGEAIVAIEPGTPAGYSSIIRAREHLLSQGATTVAPCPHDRPCPLPPTDWCHFAQRLPRSRVHRSAKETNLSYEDEKYSYVAMSRHSGLDVNSRVIRHPHTSKGMVRLVLCTEEGLDTAVITRKRGEEYKQARRLKWGSAIRADGIGGDRSS
jgi:ribosomal protein RSM22 (predicted rRNA methylase)